jgi:hypothetical protein
MVVLPLFCHFFYNVGNKIDKITRIFDRVEHIKSQEVTYWAEKKGQQLSGWLTVRKVVKRNWLL